MILLHGQIITEKEEIKKNLSGRDFLKTLVNTGACIKSES